MPWRACETMAKPGASPWNTRRRVGHSPKRGTSPCTPGAFSLTAGEGQGSVFQTSQRNNLDTIGTSV